MALGSSFFGAGGEAFGAFGPSGASGTFGAFAVCGHHFGKSLEIIFAGYFGELFFLQVIFVCEVISLRFTVFGLCPCAVLAVCFVMCPMLVMFCLLGVYCLRTVYYQFAACPVFHPISIASFWSN